MKSYSEQEVVDLLLSCILRMGLDTSQLCDFGDRVFTVDEAQQEVVKAGHALYDTGLRGEGINLGPISIDSLDRSQVSMFASRGTNVTPIFVDGRPSGGSAYDNQVVRLSELKEGRVYKIDRCFPFTWKDEISLIGIPNVRFNANNFVQL